MFQLRRLTKHVMNLIEVKYKISFQSALQYDIRRLYVESSVSTRIMFTDICSKEESLKLDIYVF